MATTTIPTDPDLRLFYDAESSMRLSRTKIALALGAILMPLGVVLDYSLNHHIIETFALIRGVSTGLLLVGLWMVAQWNWGRRISEFSIGLLLVPAIAICMMIYFSRDAATTYFFGLILLMIFVQLLGFNGIEATVYGMVTVAAYLAAVLANRTIAAAEAEVTLALFFLITSGVVAVTVCQLNYRNRLTDFLLRRSLDEKNHQLELADRQRMDFLANVSHELRTPLAMIIAPLDEMLSIRGAIPDTVGQPLALVRRNADRLRVLVDDLLDVVRLDHQSFRLQLDDVDARDFLQEVIATARPIAELRGLRLRTTCTARPLDLRLDVGRFERVLMNLLSNAFKFSPPNGSVDVYLKAEGRNAVIEVIDEGPGIPAPERQHIFDRMFQASSTSSLSSQGLGLGLAISKEIVQWHGGTIAVEEASGGGSRFIVSIPVAESQEDEDKIDGAERTDDVDEGENEGEREGEALEAGRGGPHLRESDVSENALPENGTALVAVPKLVPQSAAETGLTEAERNATVLVIDDEHDLRVFLQKSLAAEFGAVSAATAATGIQRAKQLVPRCILLDFMLPDGDGLSVLRELRNLPELGDTKIIMLTAHFDENVKIEALQRGADDFLSKPFGLTEVRARVASLIRSSRLQADLRAEREELRRSLKKLEATEAQLFHSEKMRAVASLAAGLLHEINNPVSYTLMATKALRRDLAKQRDPAETVDDIEEGIQRIAEIISDLRAFAYPQEDTIQNSFPLHDAIVTALRFAAHEAAGITIEADEPAIPGPPVLGSRSQITQVLLNLMLNGVKALRTRPDTENPRVVIATRYECDTVVVTVKDNGPGIPESLQERVMDPFFTTSEPGEGLGLGLSICHTIVKSHGGHLTIHSGENRGTEVSFALPLHTENRR